MGLHKGEGVQGDVGKFVDYEGDFVWVLRLKLLCQVAQEGGFSAA
jgi:hypothetical protein